MRIGVIQATSQREKNHTLYQCVLNAVARNGREDAVVNYGVFAEEDAAYSYVETAVNISLLLASGAADFIDATGAPTGWGWSPAWRTPER